MGKTETQILKLLKLNNPLTLNEISENLEIKPKRVFKSLRKLFQDGKIMCNPKTRQYTIEGDSQY